MPSQPLPLSRAAAQERREETGGPSASPLQQLPCGPRPQRASSLMLDPLLINSGQWGVQHNAHRPWPTQLTVKGSQSGGSESASSCHLSAALTTFSRAHIPDQTGQLQMGRRLAQGPTAREPFCTGSPCTTRSCHVHPFSAPGVRGCQALQQDMVCFLMETSGPNKTRLPGVWRQKPGQLRQHAHQSVQPAQRCEGAAGSTTDAVCGSLFWVWQFGRKQLLTAVLGGQQGC